MKKELTTNNLKNIMISIEDFKEKYPNINTKNNNSVIM